MESTVHNVTVEEAADLTSRPLPPVRAADGSEFGVFKGSVMDWSKTPESMLPEHLYAAVSFDAVNRVFRDSKVFNSHIYDSTIGLFIGPTILAMEGKKHWEHRNLVSAAFKTRSLARWEPEIVRPVVNGLIDEFIDVGHADLVKQFTLEFPTRVISKLLGLPEEDLPWFRKRAVELISYTVKWKRAFEASAELKDYFLQQIEQRRSKPTEDIIGDLVTAEIDGEKLTDEAIYSFLRLLLPAGLETTYRSSGNLLFLLLTHPEQFRAVQADRDLIGPAIEEGLRYRDAADHGAALRHRGDRTRGRHPSRRARSSTCASARPTVTSSAGNARRNSTSTASACRTYPLPQANTPAWGCIWPGWRHASPSNACWIG